MESVDDVSVDVEVVADSSSRFGHSDVAELSVSAVLGTVESVDAESVDVVSEGVEVVDVSSSDKVFEASSIIKTINNRRTQKYTFNQIISKLQGSTTYRDENMCKNKFSST